MSAAPIAYETRLGPDELAYVHARGGDDRLPLVAVIHGSHVHPRFYTEYARALAAEGFAVVAPEHVREFMGSTAHYPQQAAINWVLDWAIAENDRDGSPLHGRIDTDHLFVTGHSMGGGAVLGIVADSDQHGLVVDPWSRPPQLIAAIAHGTHNIPPPRTGPPIPVDNRVPVAFIHGSNDGVVTLEQSRRSFEAVHGVGPRLFVELEGGTHFYVTDVDAPEGAHADKNGPAALDQATGVASAARWSARWFRATLGDQEALQDLRAGAGADEPHVTVEFTEA